MSPAAPIPGPTSGILWRLEIPVSAGCLRVRAIDLILSIIKTGFIVDIVFSYIERILQRWLVEMCIATSIFPYSVYEETNFPFL